MCDHAVLIDYNSTDRSVDIIKEICPNWEVRKSRNEMFEAGACDEEVKDIEQEFSGYRLALNTTEFLLGNVETALASDPGSLNMKSFVMVDRMEDLPSYPNYDTPLIEQCQYGFVNLHYRQNRTIHNYCRFEYGKGRHSFLYDTELLAICWFGWAPWNEYTMKRKLQIQTKIPPEQFKTGSGTQHLIDIDGLTKQYEHWSKKAYNLKPFIQAIHNYGKI